ISTWHFQGLNLHLQFTACYLRRFQSKRVAHADPLRLGGRSAQEASVSAMKTTWRDQRAGAIAGRQVRRGCARTAEVRLGEVHRDEIRLQEVRAAEVRLDEVCPAKVRPDEVRPDEFPPH